MSLDCDMMDTSVDPVSTAMGLHERVTKLEQQRDKLLELIEQLRTSGDKFEFQHFYGLLLAHVKEVEASK